MNDTLEHYGVKGMKWRKRRAEARMAKKARKKAEKQSKKTDEEWNAKYKKRSDMTDDEIAAATKRLRLENEFANQVAQSSKVNKKTPIGDHIKNVSTTTKALSSSQKQAAGIATATASGIGLAYRYKDKIPDLANAVYRTAKKIKSKNTSMTASNYQKLLPPPSNW
jgi:hypothetical protein